MRTLAELAAVRDQMGDVSGAVVWDIEIQKDTLGALPFESLQKPGEMVHMIRMKREGKGDLFLLSAEAYERWQKTDLGAALKKAVFP